MITGANRTKTKIQHSISKWRVTLERGTDV